MSARIRDIQLSPFRRVVRAVAHRPVRRKVSTKRRACGTGDGINIRRAQGRAADREEDRVKDAGTE
jgi:hypothetical protein